jgi:Tfp pilus assembly protein PilE
MTRSIRSILGATLLEVMLVLSIVGLIILMSVKYYQSATSSSQIQQVMGMIQAITSAADNIAASGSGYTSSALTASNLKAIAGSNALSTPWGSTVTVTAGGSNSYTVSIPSVPQGVATIVCIKLKANSKYTGATCTGGTVAYTYNASS